MFRFQWGGNGCGRDPDARVATPGAVGAGPPPVDGARQPCFLRAMRNAFMRGTALVLFVCGSGCSGGSAGTVEETAAPGAPAEETAAPGDDTEPVASAGDEQPPSCEARMDRLGVRLRALADDGMRLTSESNELVVVEDARRVDRGGTVVVITAEGEANLSGRQRADGTLAEQLELERQMYPERAGQPFYLAPRAGTPASAVLRATVVVAANTREARLLVAGPMPEQVPSDEQLLAVPEVAALRRDLAGADPSQAATLIASALSEAIAPCTPVIKLFGSVATVAPEDKAAVVAGAADAARECNCQMADLDVFEYAILAALDAFERPGRWIPVPELDAGDDRPMAEVIGGR